jgi:tetratricopeptide (TPR) repeat protein
VRAGFLSPRRGPRREYRFTFEDLVLLRAAAGLVAARIPARRVLEALRSLRRQLPDRRSLAGVRIAAAGSEITVRDGGELWEPVSGQVVLDFEVAALARHAAPLTLRRAEAARAADSLAADEWYDLAWELEAASTEEAEAAYQRALDLDPGHVDAHVNLGRLLHEQGKVAAAERHYRTAFGLRPGDGTAAFNLGVALEDLGREREAMGAYQAAIDAEPDNADAYYNLSGLCERLGQRATALAHLKAYRRLVRG